jgi:hypothetical protein
LVCSYWARLRSTESWIPDSTLRKLSVVFDSHACSQTVWSLLQSPASVPAASLLMSWSSVQQLYALAQTVWPISVAVFSTWIPWTPPQPAQLAARNMKRPR